MGTPRYVVNGPCWVQVDPGTGFETLGVTRAGAQIQVTRQKVPIMSDAAGPAVPAEFQNVGVEAEIRLELATWDPTTLEKILALVTGNAVGEESGINPVGIGSLVGTTGYTFGLYLPAITEAPWWFPTATIRNPDTITVGTVAEPKVITFYAWPFCHGNSTDNFQTPCYHRSAPP